MTNLNCLVLTLIRRCLDSPFPEAKITAFISTNVQMLSFLFHSSSFRLLFVTHDLIELFRSSPIKEVELEIPVFIKDWYY